MARAKPQLRQATQREAPRPAAAAVSGGACRFEAVFHASAAPMLVSTVRDDRVVEANDACCAALGIPREKLIGKRIDELGFLVRPSDRAEMVSDLTRGPVRGREVEFRHIDGRTGWVTLSASVVALDGEPCALVAVTDVTERHEAEQALRVSEERYRTLVKHTADAVMLLDDDVRILDVNPACVELMGRPAEELRGTSFFDYVENLGEVPDQRFALAGGQTLVFERRLRRPDGSVVDTEVHARHIEGFGVIGVARDVSRRKAAERERARLIQAVEQSADSILITDPDGTVVYANPAMERSAGLSREKAIGQNFRVLQAELQPQEFYTRVLETVLRDGTWSGEITSHHKDGSVTREWTSLTAVHDESGALANYVVVQRDVTHERDLEEQLRQSQKMEAVGRLAGGVAHDFNNLLTAISGFAELASMEAEPGSEMAEHLAEIRRSTERAAALTRQLLAFGRRTVLQPQVLDLNQVVADIAPVLRRLIGEDVELVVNPGPGLRATLADRGQIDQVIVNLAANARDAMPRGGRMTIATANVHLDRKYAAQHHGVTPGDYVRLTVADTGVGMDAGTVEHVFEPFFSTKGPGRGTGLGLSTVFGIVNQSGGHIRAESEPGKGSLFTIDLPVAESAPAATAAEPPVAPSTRGHETILVVEDEPTVLSFVQELLTRNGYLVLSAPNGEAAVELARRHSGPIDLLFSDMVMPGLSGRETVSAVRATRPHIKELLSSGYDEEMSAGRGRMNGFAFVSKPFAAEELLRAVRAALDAS
jgi:two-component system cell cycle sensor histidine kinase/response regulator CckA